ncbi:MAG: Asp-tRNA(Asn)/Glu-tRNA(Gln) amidotransferase subunit GatC [Rickettsiales bacterium]|jgi:aspartyl-tRNA(Asn)/glutamyl-tRNA(Gln) amidotransferase subunit C|nr:Asp-tRNA(Asn)/Glu-tRNA(Gln) amidotransferase subunit GatC [Rickettsiales bacterium]
MDEDKLRKLEKLAMIEIKDGDLVRILSLVNTDIADVKTLYDIDTEGLEPLINPHDMILEVCVDDISDGNLGKELMKCAPDSKFGYFVVPKVIED